MRPAVGAGIGYSRNRDHACDDRIAGTRAEDVDPERVAMLQSSKVVERFLVLLTPISGCYKTCKNPILVEEYIVILVEVGLHSNRVVGGVDQTDGNITACHD